MFGNSLAEEYASLIHFLDFTPDDIQHIILNGIQASWLSDDRKAELEQDFIRDPAWHTNVTSIIGE
jgi:adenosine deaminase